MKKILCFTLVVLVLFINSLTVVFAANVSIVIDGKPIKDINTVTVNGKTYVDPVSFSKYLGAEASVDSINIIKVDSYQNDVIIPEIIKKVSPSVVGIIGTINSGGSDISSSNIAHGTGVIIKSDGSILTNAHVVSDMKTIVVVLNDGNGYKAKLQYIDYESDLAVVKINKTKLPVAQLGTEDEIVSGKTVIAIGTPISFSLRNSASIGIVSGINRGIGSSYRLIQTDASINPGNSGGPLVNLKGHVIGINSNKFSGTGIEGIGFSIPINTVKYVLENFEKYGYVKRAYLGAIFKEDFVAEIGLPTNNGLLIDSVEDDSPADVSGLQEDDILLKINSSPINTIVDYNEFMKKIKPNDKIALEIKRESKTIKISVQVTEK